MLFTFILLFMLLFILLLFYYYLFTYFLIFLCCILPCHVPLASYSHILVFLSLVFLLFLAELVFSDHNVSFCFATVVLFLEKSYLVKQCIYIFHVL